MSQKTGPPGAVGKKPLPPTYLFSAILGMAILHFLFPVRTILRFPLILTGLLPFALGAYLNMSADRLFKQAETTVKPYEESSSLITGGVFRISRNPMYLGFILILAGLALMAGTLSPWLVIPAFAVVMEFVFIRPEERMLEETFGDAWLDYRAGVRKWI